jgi:hypothetical protein
MPKASRLTHYSGFIFLSDFFVYCFTKAVRARLQNLERACFEERAPLGKFTKNPKYDFFPLSCGSGQTESAKNEVALIARSDRRYGRRRKVRRKRSFDKK